MPKTPSLIGSTMGACKFVETGTRGRKRTCKRCKVKIDRGAYCVEIGIPGSMGRRTYCTDCFADILNQTGIKLEELRRDLSKIT